MKIRTQGMHAFIPSKQVGRNLARNLEARLHRKIGFAIEQIAEKASFPRSSDVRASQIHRAFPTPTQAFVAS